MAGGGRAGVWGFSRGGGGGPRLRQLKYGGRDYGVLLFFLAVTVLVGVLGHFGL